MSSSLLSVLCSETKSIPAPELSPKMYVPLQVEPRFWFNPRAKLDSRLSPSPSIQALKVVRDTNKKHLRFIAQHEKNLLQRMDPEDANQVYMQLGLKRPGPGEKPWSDPSDESNEPYRLGDLLPITVVGLRSHHHPVAEVKTQAFTTWKAMRDDYYSNQYQAEVRDSSSWVVQNDNDISEVDSWATEESPWGEEPADLSTSASTSASTSDYDDDDTDNNIQWYLQGNDWWGSEAGTDSCGEKGSRLFPEPPARDDWLAKLPTPPPSDTYSLPSSPVLSESQFALAPGTPESILSTASSVSDDSGSSAREELSQVLNDRKIMEAFLEGIVKRIKESYMSKSEKEAVKAVENKKCRTTRREEPRSRGNKRGDPRRALGFCHSPILSPEQAEQHTLEKTCKSHFENHFLMTHQYEDTVGEVHAEPVATQGVPPENKFEWMKTHRKRQPRF